VIEMRIGFVIVFCGLPSYATENLECPEIGSSAVPNIIGDATGAGLVTTGNSIDIANEINELINRLQTSGPNISSSEMQDILIAAYCRVVVNTSGLTVSEKWRRMRQFDSILQQQIAANTMPPGTLIRQRPAFSCGLSGTEEPGRGLASDRGAINSCNLGAGCR
jgi:hypothetical protein